MLIIQIITLHKYNNITENNQNNKIRNTIYLNNQNNIFENENIANKQFNNSTNDINNNILKIINNISNLNKNENNYTPKRKFIYEMDIFGRQKNGYKLLMKN